MSILTKNNAFVCQDCGSGLLGYICTGCGRMVCSCKGCVGCVDDEAERERDERDAYLARQQEAVDRVMSGDF